MNPNTYLSFVFGSLLISAAIARFLMYPVLKAEHLKKVKPDITSKEMYDLETDLSNFLKEHNLDVGSSIWKIAQVLKVQNGGVSNDIKERAKIYDIGEDGTKVVIHNAHVPENERLFDFAHELAHLINNDSVPANRPDGHNKPKKEQLADYTGAALLMPRKHVLDYLIENGYESATKKARLKIIRKLSKRYQVSDIVAIRRVNEVRLLRDIYQKHP